MPTLWLPFTKMSRLSVEVAHLEFGCPAAPVEKHVPLIARQPPVRLRPLAKVEVAVVEAATKTDAVEVLVTHDCPSTDSVQLGVVVPMPIPELKVCKAVHSLVFPTLSESVPVVVMEPPESPEPACTLVTVPLLPPPTKATVPVLFTEIVGLLGGPEIVTFVPA